MNIFAKIIISLLAAFIIVSFFVMMFIKGYVFMFSSYMCIVFFIPAVIIILALFLIIIRTPIVKSINNKKVTIFCILLVILIIIASITLIWPSISPTYKARLSTYKMLFSNDNSRLFVMSKGTLIVTSSSILDYVYDYQVWDVNTGALIWNMSTSDYYYSNIAVSPDGWYIVNNDNHSIFSIRSGAYIEKNFGKNIIWVNNGEKFITSNETHLFIWDAKNFTIINSMAYSNANKIVPSYDGSKVAIIPDVTGLRTLSVIDTTQENTTYLFNTSVSDYLESILWSTDGNELQLISRPYIFKNYSYQVLVWNPMNNILIKNTSFNYSSGEHGNNFLYDIWFGRYVINNFDNRQIIVFNFEGKKEHIYKFYDIVPWKSAVWSYDKKVMAHEKNGIIEIQNSSTEKIITTLTLPTYEFKREVPGFELILVVCAITLVLFLIRKRKI